MPASLVPLRMKLLTSHLGAAALLACAVPAAADTPALDRPGIAFATDTLPRAGVAIEQGLPDFSYSRDGGVKTTAYTADTNLRIGVSDIVELQLATALFNHLKIEGAGSSQTQHGRGDTRLGAKVALPSSSENFSWASLASVTLSTGEQPFTNDATQYDLGLALALDLANGLTAGFYVNGTRLAGDNSLAISPSLSFGLTDTVGAYVEAGYFTEPGAQDSAVAGAGLTWMATPTIQLDASADFGLNASSADVAGGIGVSIFFP